MRVHQHSKEGFTLIELLIVVAILGILSAVAIPQFRDYQARTKENAVRANHKQVVNLLSGEFAKCSAGETTAQIGTQTALTCSTATVSNFATTVAAYFAAEGVTSPYDAGTNAVSAAAAGTTQGLTYVTATDATNTIVVTSVPVTGSTQVSTIVRE